MSEISKWDGKVLKPLFKGLHKSGIGTPFVMLAMKVLEYIANGPNPNGRYGKRIKWSDFDKILMVGQSHLDAAWRWRTKQGIIKARATFKKALDHIDELPYFTYTQPSPQYYQWIKDTDPEYISKLYPRIKKAVRDGRWVLLGGCWVEPDTNLPCGESLVRQRLYGQRFYLKEFGHISDVEFLMDCFGFNWNLPQIFKKSGAKLFGTGKLFWNKNTKIPIGMCHWKGPDGTRLPMIHINFGYFLPITIGKDFPNIYLLGKDNKSLVADYETPINEFFEWYSDDLMLEQPFGYGLGDGGHGPIEAELLIVRTMKRLFRKNVKFYQKGDLYTMFKKYFSRWATWKDEWYLDLHRGTYTSVSRVKRGNRETENKIIQLEKISSILSLLGINKNEFNREKFELYWKKILYNQFHDILPGSSCPEVYLDYDEDRKEIINFIHSTNSKIQDLLLNSVKIKSDYGIPFVIFNPLSWERKSIGKLNIGKKNKGIIKDEMGNILESKVVPNSWDTLNPSNQENIVLIDLTKNPVPPLGYKTFYFKDISLSEANDGIIEDKKGVSIKKTKSHFILSNEFLKVKINKKSGLIDFLSSQNDEEFNVFSSPSNRIKIYEELKNTNAWNIDPNYEKNEIQYDVNNCQIKIWENNSLRACIEIKRNISKSSFTQRISLEKGSKSCKTSLDVDLKNKKWLVKLEYNTSFLAEDLTSEIPYAYIDRPIEHKTKLDSARWEHACQKWISIYDKKSNKSLIVSNNGKYGVNAKNKGFPEKHTIICPTVVRSPQYTGYASETKFVNKAKDGGIDPNMPHYTDLKQHLDIKYSICINEGDWRNSGWNYAYNLNFPLRQNLLLNKKIKFNQTGDMPSDFSLVSINQPNIRNGAFKIHEDENKNNPSKYIMRLVEQIGEKTECTLSFNENISLKNCSRMDLLEFEEKNQKQEKLELEGNDLKITIKPHEILSLLIELDR